VSIAWRLREPARRHTRNDPLDLVRSCPGIPAASPRPREVVATTFERQSPARRADSRPARPSAAPEAVLAYPSVIRRRRPRPQGKSHQRSGLVSVLLATPARSLPGRASCLNLVGQSVGVLLQAAWRTVLAERARLANYPEIPSERSRVANKTETRSENGQKWPT
jgi:hypothetical protein